MPFLSTIGGGSQKGFYAKTGSDWGDGVSTNATVTEYVSKGVTYRAHTFTTAGSSGTFNWTGQGVDKQQVDILIVAGGGGGGSNIQTASGGCGGGGGGGGCRFYPRKVLADGSYTITVGAGGNGSTSAGQDGQNGGNSSAFGITIDGGGGGGWTSDNTSSADIHDGLAGGSGGGSAGGDQGGYHLGGKSTAGQGHAGGQGTGNTAGDYAGGGGGASCAGMPGRDNEGCGSGGAGLRNNWATGSAQYYAAGGGTGDGGSGNEVWNSGNSDNGNGSFQGNVTNMHVYNSGGGHMGGQNQPNSGNAGSQNGSATNGFGGGGGGSNSGNNGGNGGSGVVIVRYPIDGNKDKASYGSSASMEEYQGLSAGTHTLATENGQSTMSITIVDQDGRKWAKIPYSTTSTGNGVVNGQYFQSNWLFSQHSYGNHIGEMCWDSSRRWTNQGYEENGYNVNTHYVMFDIGIKYRYVRLYCTGIQSNGSTSGGPPNCDWGGGGSTANDFGDDLAGGMGDHPYWIIGADLSGADAQPRYKAMSGNSGASDYISGSSGGWSGGEQGDITRSWTSGIQDCGVDSNGNGYYHDRVGIGISGGPGEVYRHNEGYFLIA